MRLFSAWMAVTYLLMGCASQSFERDRTDSNYQKGWVIPPDQGLRQQENPGAQAAGATALAGASLAANPKYYVGTSIQGKCFLRNSEKDLVDLPCPTVELLLKPSDQEGKGIRTESADGAFSFQVERNTRYRLQLRSKKYRLVKGLSSPLERDLFAGDEVILRLEPIPREG